MAESPNDLVFVRHGRSEANELKHFFSPDREQHLSDDVLNRHAERHPLTQEGVDQAQAVGRWIANQLMLAEDVIPDHFFTSPLVRTEQTAGYIGLEIEKEFPSMHVNWTRDRNLREQQRGDIEHLRSLPGYEDGGETPTLSPTTHLYRRSDGGESLFDSIERWHTFANRRRHQLAGNVGILVVHGYYMGAVQIAIEHPGVSDRDAWKAFDERSVANGNIFHYSAREPETGKVADRLRWVRAVMPYESDKGVVFEWKEIDPEEHPSSSELIDFNRRYKNLLPPVDSV